MIGERRRGVELMIPSMRTKDWREHRMLHPNLAELARSSVEGPRPPSHSSAWNEVAECEFRRRRLLVRFALRGFATSGDSRGDGGLSAVAELPGVDDGGYFAVGPIS